ncbi:ABC transporter ATP-binding protein [Stratiformator vulcanicus]|uniref:Heterocyst differentiation ATP-binding protein HepA n=1 Tax=Stratiformator vulcanicus TaxID=2527980 RepID=A0A517R691_9PLAN|nr:ABC transporter ATP-binding protein [Stratiformator vulcanicus]QDT39391.1 Heterocyst differentiation ATP-binding protein HepA [Stratiformator vulcanicus]
MSQNVSETFQRVFPRWALFRGAALGSVLCSLVGSITLCLLLVDGFLIADLLESRGRVVVEVDDAEEFYELRTGRPAEPPADGPVPLAPVMLTEVVEDGGLLHAVWWSRSTPFGPVFYGLYHAIPAFQGNRTTLLILIGAGVVLGLLRAGLLSIARGLSDRAALETVTRLRRMLHRQALRLGTADLTGRDSNNIVQFFTEDCDRIRDGVALFAYRIGRHPAKLVLLSAMAFSVQWLVTLQCLLPLAVCWFLFHRERRRMAETTRAANAVALREIRLLSESLTRARLIRGFGMEQFDEQRFEQELGRYQKDATALRKRQRASRVTFRTLLIICFALVVLLIGIKVLAGAEGMTLAAALLLLAIFGAMYRPAEMLIELRRDRIAAAEAADRVYRYLNRSPTVAQAVGAKFLQPLSDRIRFESVSYKSPDRGLLLDRLDLQVFAGKFVAIVATEPMAGRAIVDLLPRFIEPTSGRIRYDNEDTAWATLESLRAETVIASVREQCFSYSIRENITAGREEVSLHQVIEAAKIARAHNFIQKLEQGYETVIGAGGEDLNVGQQFRISLARAILRDPAVLVIEEPEEPFDEDTKSLIDDAYKRIFPGRTVIMLPQRLSSLKKADEVALVHEGRVAGIGKHVDLIRRSPLYRHWEYVRYNEFRVTDSQVIGDGKPQ